MIDEKELRKQLIKAVERLGADVDGNVNFKAVKTANAVLKVVRPYLRHPERETVDLNEIRLLALATLGILPDEGTCTPEEVKQDAILICRTAQKYLRLTDELTRKSP